MPEQLSYWLDSCHSNQGAWQLMFHPQINYGMLLIEENVRFFFFFFLFFFLFHELVFGDFASLSYFFPKINYGMPLIKENVRFFFFFSFLFFSLLN